MNLRAATAAIAVFLCCGLAAVTADAREKPIPKEPDKFTAYMADRFSAVMPGSSVATLGTLAIEIIVNGVSKQVSLANVWDFCDRDRIDCRKNIDNFLENMSGAMMEAEVVPRPENLRAIVRGSRYVAELKRVAANNPAAAGLFRPYIGDLWMVCVLDLQHGVQPITRGQLDSLHLTDDQAIALSLKNLAAALKPLDAETHFLKKLNIAFAAGDFYESSRLLLHDGWAPVAKAMHGHLVVAVPEPDMIVFGNAGGTASRMVLGVFAQGIVEKAPKPLSATLFQWTETGWTALSANGEPMEDPPL